MFLFFLVTDILEKARWLDDSERQTLQAHLGHGRDPSEADKKADKIVFADVVDACLSLTRPSFDLQRWNREHLPAHIRDDIIPEGRDSPSALPFYAETPVWLLESLRALILAVREWHHSLGMGMLNPRLATIKVFTNAAMEIMALNGYFLNHYLDSMELYDILQTPDRIAEACLGLAATYWVRRAVHDRLDGGSKFEEAGSWAFDMSLLAATRLAELDRRVIEILGKHEGEAEGVELEDRLWWLCAGTMAERNIRLRPDCGDYRDYHGMRFVQLARQLRLHESSDVETVLRRYLYLDLMGRKTKKWFLANAGRVQENAAA